jgi:hypothetical protein
VESATDQPGTFSLISKFVGSNRIFNVSEDHPNVKMG